MKIRELFEADICCNEMMSNMVINKLQDVEWLKDYERGGNKEFQF